MRITTLLIFCSAVIADAMSAQAHQTAPGAFNATVQSTDIGIEFYTPTIVRILKSPSGVAPVRENFSVVMSPDDVPVTVDYDGPIIRICSDSMTVSLDKTTGKVSFSDRNGLQLLTEKDWGTQFTPVTYGDQKPTYNVRQAFRLYNDEAIYGLGQHQTGRLNQRNQSLYLRQKNMEIAIPFYLSTKGYGVFWDNYSPTTFTDNSMETAFDSQSGSCADYYFIYGGSADNVVKGMRRLTGEVPMNALWTYGFLQSRERYRSQDETVGVVRKYRDLMVPLDGIIQDWQYWGVDQNDWNAMNFGNPKFYDPVGMIDDVHALNAHIIISVWPSFGYNTGIYKAMKERNMTFDFETYPPTAAVYDAFNPEAREIYWDHMNRNIFAPGMDGWWLDATEPVLKSTEDKLDQPCKVGNLRDVFNAFPIVTVGGVHDHQRAATADKRVFILTRSAFAGQQRYGAMSWSGDINSDWNVLKDQIPAGLNFSLCGNPYWNTDIGGFTSCNTYPQGVADPAFRELYVRWAQFGAFSPMMRSHGTCTPREIYQFGNRGSWEFDAIDRAIRLRYRLLPYIYSTAWSVSSNGDTFMRALVMDFPADTAVRDMDHEYMFGRSLLVRPVTDPMYVAEGGEVDVADIKSVDVYLPEGSEWYDFWTGERYSGGRTVTKEAPVDIIPLYVRAGTVLPIGPEVQYASEKPWDDLEIRIYPGADGVFTLYDDEGDNYNYERGARSTISFTWHDKDRRLVISDRDGSYPGMPDKRRFRIVVVDDNHGAADGESARIDKTIVYKGRELSARLR